MLHFQTRLYHLYQFMISLWQNSCGKSICKGCIHSCRTSGNDDKCPFCNSDRGSNTDEEGVEEIRKRVGANDPGATCLLAYYYSHGLKGLQQDHSKAIELYTRSANLGFSQAHNNLAGIYSEGGVMDKNRHLTSPQGLRYGTARD